MDLDHRYAARSMGTILDVARKRTEGVIRTLVAR
jgi:hypothetical protein